MAGREAAETAVDGSLSNASVDRLTCLLRHWAWADEAMARFEQQLAGGWQDDEVPVADHPFGRHCGARTSRCLYPVAGKEGLHDLEAACSLSVAAAQTGAQ